MNRRDFMLGAGAAAACAALPVPTIAQAGADGAAIQRVLDVMVTHISATMDDAQRAAFEDYLLYGHGHYKVAVLYPERIVHFEHVPVDTAGAQR